MSAEELRRQTTAVPLHPFLLDVADGRQIPVADRDLITVSPSGLIVDVLQRDDAHDILDMLMITGVTRPPLAPAGVPQAAAS